MSHRLDLFVATEPMTTAIETAGSIHECCKHCRRPTAWGCRESSCDETGVYGGIWTGREWLNLDLADRERNEAGGESRRAA